MTLKALRKSLMLVTAAAALTAGAVIAPAASASAADLQPAKSGMAVIQLNSPRHADGETHTKDVGGGSWTYGWELTTGGKRCFSYYFHGSKMHHATAKIGLAENRAYAFAKQTAKASTTAGAAYVCYTWWSVDE